MRYQPGDRPIEMRWKCLALNLGQWRLFSPTVRFGSWGGRIPSGQVAADGDTDHSPFTKALLDNLASPNVEINLLFRRLRDEVLQNTGDEQEPFVYGSLPGAEFYFARAK